MKMQNFFQFKINLLLFFSFQSEWEIQNSYFSLEIMNYFSSTRGIKFFYPIWRLKIILYIYSGWKISHTFKWVSIVRRISTITYWLRERRDMNRPRFTLAIRRIIEVGFFAVKFEISLQSYFSSLYTLIPLLFYV